MNKKEKIFKIFIGLTFVCLFATKTFATYTGFTPWWKKVCEKIETETKNLTGKYSFLRDVYYNSCDYSYAPEKDFAQIPHILPTIFPELKAKLDTENSCNSDNIITCPICCEELPESECHHFLCHKKHGCQHDKVCLSCIKKICQYEEIKGAHPYSIVYNTKCKREKAKTRRYESATRTKEKSWVWKQFGRYWYFKDGNSWYRYASKKPRRSTRYWRCIPERECPFCRRKIKDSCGTRDERLRRRRLK